MLNALTLLLVGVTNGGWLAHWYEIAGIIVALPIVAVCVWRILTFFTHVQGVHEAIVGKPATADSEAVPSMIARFKAIDEGVAAAERMAEAAAKSAVDVTKELHPNGGSSVRDSLDRNERITVATGERVGKMGAQIDAHIVADTRRWEELGEIGRASYRE